VRILDEPNDRWLDSVTLETFGERFRRLIETGA